MSNKMITIIVPILNEEENISMFVLSIIEQTYRPIELILIDGGSIDKTLFKIYSIINKNIDNTFNIRLISEYGIIKTPANARNIGLDNTSGKFIMIIDCDTVFTDKNILQSTISEMRNDNSILIEFTPIIDTELEQFILDTYGRSGVILYKKALIGNHRFVPLLGYGEDRVFTYEIFKNLDYIAKVASKNIGRHYPHTLKEYAKQNEWYGKTILKYIQVSLKTNKKDAYLRIIFIFYNVSICIFPFISVLRNYRYKPKQPIGYIKSFVYSFVASFYFTKGFMSNWRI